MSSTTVGSAVVKLTFDGSEVKSSLSSIESEAKSSGTSAGSKLGSALSVAAGNLISSGISKVVSLVSSSMDDAMARVDTLNNFSNVMTSIGYSAEDAEKSINTLSYSLDGLPTTLDDMASETQQLAATMGNLSDGTVNATSVGLALNNMFLAGSGNVDKASSAMEQYNQMLSAGKVDMQSWNTLIQTAPAQIDTMAKSLLGASANENDLYEAMQAGTVTFDDFNACLVELNENGTAEIASFTDQAIANTQGLQTQMKNISTSIARVLADALEGNDMTENLQLLADRVTATIPTIVETFASAVPAVASALVAAIPAIGDALVQAAPVVMEAVVSLCNSLLGMLPQLVQILFNLIIQIMQSLAQMLPSLISSITNMVIQLAMMLTDPANLQLMLEAAIELLLALVTAIPEIITALADALPDIIDNIVSFLTDPSTIGLILEAAVTLFFALVEAVPQILGSLLGAFGSLVASLWNGITAMFGEFAGNFGEFIQGVFKGAVNGVLAFLENVINTPIDIINGFIGIINGAFGFLGVNLGTIGRISLGRLAEGGVAFGASLNVIGEEGTEVALPLENNTGNWAGLLASVLTEEMDLEGAHEPTQITVNMTNQINNEMDADEIGRRLMESIRRAV